MSFIDLIFILYLAIIIYFLIENKRLYKKLHYMIRENLLKYLMSSLFWPFTIVIRSRKYRNILINNSLKFDLLINSIEKDYEFENKKKQ